uniref:NIDO domain-containing protein n=1 Tax=Sinocyclocheilus rhinocerous TaxID=307959 RepID=A0A673J101_9TELE
MLTQALLYPFGSAAGDTINAAVDDGSSPVIHLLSPFLFFGRTYRAIYVNNNGHLTFNQPSSAYVPYSFPARGSQDIIAGLWTNLDNRQRGVVSYRQYTSGNVLTRATQDINTHFPNLNFNASWVFVATWNKIAYFNLTNTVSLIDYLSIFQFSIFAGNIVSSVQVKETCSSISNLRNSSNVDVPGRWAFMVDSRPRNSILKSKTLIYR